jgi:hypothetical protein
MNSDLNPESEAFHDLGDPAAGDNEIKILKVCEPEKLETI